MKRDVLESQWSQIRELLREQFSNLSEEDIRQINGRYDQLVDKLQQKYGYSRGEAEERIKNWNFDRFATTKRDRPTHTVGDVKREKSSWSPLQWLLAIGLPLLLLGALLYYTTQPATTTREQVIETPEDRSISTRLRDALISQQNMTAEMQNVQITTNNGVVTLSGAVPSREARDSIVSAAENFAGVNRVIDNLQIR